MYDIDQILLNTSNHSSGHYSLENEIKTKFVYRFFKRFFDILLSVFLLIILSPVILIVSLLILFFDKQSPFYKSTRVGKNGQEFKIFKFQTMRASSKTLEELLSKEEYNTYKKNYKLDRDPRVTRLGAVLRKTSLDEIPQLVNILRGEMSLVGPRPILQEETELYGIARRTLLSVKPGLTGLWQASGRNNLDYESGKRQKIELYYVENHSFLMDVKILFMTIKAAITMNGAM